METFAPNGAPPLERAVTSAREANGQTNHAARKGQVVVGFYQQVKMIVLHSEMHDAKPPPRSGVESPAQRRKHGGRAQTGQTSHPTQRDVHGVSVAMPRAGAMGLAIMGSPGPTPGDRLKRQWELPCGFHWRRVFVTYCFFKFQSIKAGAARLLAMCASPLDHAGPARPLRTQLGQIREQHGRRCRGLRTVRRVSGA
jgi:hypothetical protein